MRSSRSLPPLNALRAFEAAGRRLNFRAAAEELSVTQGAVAQQIRGLEGRLGFPLFHRQRRGVMLTERGTVYFEAVHLAFQHLITGTDAALSQSRIVTISVTPTFASKCLIPNLPAIAAAFPDIELRVVSTAAVSDFGRDGVDLAVRLTKPPFPLGVAVDVLFSDMIVVASPDLISAYSLPLSPDDLTQFTLLVDGQASWASVLGGRVARAERHINQADLAIDAALGGQGLAMANRIFVADALKAGRLIQVCDDVVPTDVGYHLVIPKSLQRDEAVSIISDWIRRRFANPTVSQQCGL